MKQHTNKEILDKVQAIFDAEHEKHYFMGWEQDGKLEVTHNTPTQVQINVTSMYEAPSPNLNILMQLAEFFKTKNINDDDHFGETGCETCDWGSSYGYTLTIRPE